MQRYDIFLRDAIVVPNVVRLAPSAWAGHRAEAGFSWRRGWICVATLRALRRGRGLGCVAMRLALHRDAVVGAAVERGNGEKVNGEKVKWVAWALCWWQGQERMSATGEYDIYNVRVYNNVRARLLPFYLIMPLGWWLRDDSPFHFSPFHFLALSSFATKINYAMGVNFLR